MYVCCGPRREVRVWVWICLETIKISTLMNVVAGSLLQIPPRRWRNRESATVTRPQSRVQLPAPDDAIAGEPIFTPVKAPMFNIGKGWRGELSYSI